MSTLMLDPVLLPSSNVTVDRSTIARHLLRLVGWLLLTKLRRGMVSGGQRQYSFDLYYLTCSDQTDPFNRSPLTMDQIRPNEELKQQISQWLDEHKQQRLQLGPSG